ncbi:MULTISPECIES: hypothetical protein [unclassified Chryseobacterium]|uniref:hypothetical protein n=1 Tax=unclassified Chryseobacterium TaxID=2593645 RepID=UPI002852F62B|nr:hypothetical protein [Chryseobacterium sp. CFS7]MDR4895121.1 hypothetical protein [Chryseobacterium sp. CFS7]
MKTTESKGFFCVVYDKEAKKTVWYNKVWEPAKLASYLSGKNKDWLWIKIYIKKQDYFSNPDSYHQIFDKDNPVIKFNYKPFSKN